MIHRCKSSDFQRVVTEFTLSFRILFKKKKKNEKGELVIIKSLSKSSNFRVAISTFVHKHQTIHDEYFSGSDRRTVDSSILPFHQNLQPDIPRIRPVFVMFAWNHDL